MDEYRYECQTLDGFVQRIVVLAGKGYEFFIRGEVPERKAPEAVDRKLLRKYDVAYSRKERYVRKKRGLSNVHYLRHGRTWVMMATAGKHSLFLPGSKERVLSLRETPLRVGGYAVTLKRDGSEKREGRFRLRVHVRLDHDTYLRLRDYFEEIATHRSKERIASE